MLWIAVALPLLPLEAVRPPLLPSPPSPSPSSWRPAALVENARVVLADRAAHALGVRPGIARSHALALAPDLDLLVPDPVREQQALQAMALALCVFTPRISMADSHTVLLEVAGSLRLFGGVRSLFGRVAASTAIAGHAACIGCAPTPWGAWLLAQPRAAARRRRVLKMATLACVLDGLPVSLLPAARLHGAALEHIGCATLGALRRLPRAGLVRRFGESLLQALEQAYGAAPDPREAWIAPARFEARLELMARVDGVPALLFAARRLLMQLAGWLCARQAALNGYTLELVHEAAIRVGRAGSFGAPAGEASRVGVSWALPSRDADHFGWLLREKLERTQLAAPVLELRLIADSIVPYAPDSDTLFPLPGADRDSVAALLDRLGARLGAERVRRVALNADHRPETAMVSMPSSAPPARMSAASRENRRNAGEAVRSGRKGRDAPATRAAASEPPGRAIPAGPADRADPSAAAPRPAWLLERPQPLAMRGDHPVYRTALRLVAGPERIEAGWWDGQGASRDYFIALDEQAAAYWIYRERPQGGWFLHGVFA